LSNFLLEILAPANGACKMAQNQFTKNIKGERLLLIANKQITTLPETAL